MLNKLKNIFYFILLFNLFTIFSVNCKYISKCKDQNTLLVLNEISSVENLNKDSGINPLYSEPSDNNILDIKNNLQDIPIPLPSADNSIKVNDKTINVNKHSNDNIGKIIDLKLENKDNFKGLTFYLTKDFSTQVKVVNFPFRIIFDAPMPYIWAVPQDQLEQTNLIKIVSSIRYGNPDEKTFRVNTNLKFPVKINSAYFITDNNNDNIYKLVINFREADILTNLLNSCTTVIPQTNAYYAMLDENAIKDEGKTINLKRKVAVNKWISSYLKNIDYPAPVIQGGKNSANKLIVVIDPGHGGKDPGAKSSVSNNVYEKDIVLNISNMIANNLLKNPNISVVLTRKGDYFVPLKDRVLWARNFNADLFISIHADRAPSPDSSGLSVYTLSQNASDAQTQVIATNENKSDIIAGLNNEEDTEVSKILINLLQRLKINDSVTLAQSILSSAAENVKLLPHPLRSAGFVVLQVPETPSILIETGFLSNEKDAKSLATQEYQKLVAEKISRGIENYLISSGKIK